MAKRDMQQLGYWAFVIGVIVAVLAGLATGAQNGKELDSAAAVGAALVVLGIVVGWFNVKEKAFTVFMIAAVALISGATANFSLLDKLIVGPYITGILGYVALFAAPAAIMVALKVVWNEAAGA
jgi:undecaprenyl pyrophosphate phosphatase UppP